MLFLNAAINLSGCSRQLRVQSVDEVSKRSVNENVFNFRHAASLHSSFKVFTSNYVSINVFPPIDWNVFVFFLNLTNQSFCLFSFPWQCCYGFSTPQLLTCYMCALLCSLFYCSIKHQIPTVDFISVHLFLLHTETKQLLLSCMKTRDLSSSLKTICSCLFRVINKPDWHETITDCL